MEETLLEKWTGGIPYELAFWNNVYRWRWTYEGLIHWSHYGSVIQLEGFDANALLAGQQHPVVLDVGCGMSYATGNYVETKTGRQPLDIHYVDPLAAQFNKILKRHHRRLPAIEYGMMEYLSAFYPKGSASLIVIQNALDHSSNPVKGILEALRTLPVGGVLYLNHHPNEAETEHYKGFHQFNVDIAQDRLVIWNKTSRFDISTLLAGKADVEVSRYDNGHIIAVITKLAEIDSLCDDQADRKALCVGIEGLVASQLQFRKMAAFKLKYMMFNLIQCCVQALPWKLKMGLKRLVHQA